LPLLVTSTAHVPENRTTTHTISTLITFNVPHVLQLHIRGHYTKHKPHVKHSWQESVK
jgi:hypothetical protein